MSVLLGIGGYLLAATIVATVMRLTSGRDIESGDFILIGAVSMFWPILGLYAIITGPGWLISRYGRSRS